MSKTFSHLIEEKFLNQIFEELEVFIDNEIESIDLKLQLVETIDNYQLHDIYLKQIYIFDKGHTIIDFNLLVEADIEVSEKSNYVDEQELVSHWFLVECTLDFTNINGSFNVNEIRSYYKGLQTKKSEYDVDLVPIINSENYDKFANDILKKYYPEGLSTKHIQRIDPLFLADRIGLKVIKRAIDNESLIFGQTFFKDREVSFYSEKGDICVPEVVESGTIVVDPNNFFLRNIGSVSNTIAHEIVHWIYHQKAFLLAHHFNNEIGYMTSLVRGGMKEKLKNDATTWMERQANGIAPKILMPYAPFKTKATNLINILSDGLDEIDRLDVMPQVIDELANFFCVSKQSAKIRLLEVGFKQVLGTNIFLDNHYVNPHTVSEGVVWDSQTTYTLDTIDAARLSFAQPELAEKISTGNYIFVENHFVLNDPLYVQKNLFGDVELTDYARLNIDKCCLAFTIDITSQNYASKDYFRECILCRDAESKVIFGYTFNNELKPDEENIQLAAYIQEVTSFLSVFPRTFPEALKACIEWSEMTQEAICDNSRVDSRTLRRLKKGESEPKIQTIISLCIGMRLHPEISFELIKTAGYNFRPIEQDFAYKFILNSCYSLGIEECNKKLLQMNIESL